MEYRILNDDDDIIIREINETMLDFFLEVERAALLYKSGRFVQSEDLQRELIDKLDDVCRSYNP